MPSLRICANRSVQFLAMSVLAAASALAQGAQPRSFTIASKPVAGVVKTGAGTDEVSGEASYAPTFASPDDIVIGTLSYRITDEARARIAQLTGKAPEDIPAALTRQDVVASFQEGTTCPDLRLNLGSMDLAISGIAVLLPDFVLEVRDSDDEMVKLLCIWARQIGAGKPRVGVIRAINRLLAK